jgi:hypothetical protein
MPFFNPDFIRTATYPSSKALCIIFGPFRMEASSGGYIVRRAFDPNHQSDAAVQ